MVGIGLSAGVRRFFLLVGVLMFAAPFLIPAQWLPSADVCLFRRATDLPCAGCGLTRSVLAVAAGQWAEAWRAHPFGFVYYGIAVLLALSPWWGRSRSSLRWLFLGGSALALALLVFGLIRLALRWAA